MLRILNVENLNVDGNIMKKWTKKKQIFLYDTQRRFDDFIVKLQYRRNGKFKDIPHFVITKNGVIYKIFDTKYVSTTFNIKEIDNPLIKICLENLGWLKKNTITGVLHNWVGDPFRQEPYVKKWRNHYFWDPYTNEQLSSLTILTKHLCEQYKIPHLSVPSQGYLSNVTKFNGIVCKSNFLDIYTDINPSFNFNIFKNEKDK